jgi:glycosyltransferase involved in cell wall biosynthesis
MPNPTVEVLLATYNGERFLREQIDTILAQTYEPLTILARDDGSTDATPALLATYAAQHPTRFRILTGPPTGSAKYNFIELLKYSSADYIAFADQDDIWLPEKIALEMQAMQQLEATHSSQTPLLVFTDLRVVNQTLEILHASFWQHQPIHSTNIHRLNRLLAQNVATGCTALINRPLGELATHMPAEAHMHDWWIAILACTFGASQPIAQQTVLYRQHDSNVLGASKETTHNTLPDLHNHTERRKPWDESVNMARALLATYDNKLTLEQRVTVQAFLTCDTHTNRFVRLATWLGNRLFLTGGLRPNLALLWYLWDK